MLQNRDGWFVELGDQICGGADVENVVKGKFFAVKFLETAIEVAVERGGLMRVFAVTQPRRERQRKGERRVGRLFAVQKTPDGAIVIGRFDEGLDGETLA